MAMALSRFEQQLGVNVVRDAPLKTIDKFEQDCGVTRSSLVGMYYGFFWAILARSNSSNYTMLWCINVGLPLRHISLFSTVRD
jgi:hypothetical protein